MAWPDKNGLHCPHGVATGSRRPITALAIALRSKRGVDKSRVDHGATLDRIQKRFTQAPRYSVFTVQLERAIAWNRVRSLRHQLRNRLRHCRTASQDRWRPAVQPGIDGRRLERLVFAPSLRAAVRATRQDGLPGPSAPSMSASETTLIT